MTSHKFQRRIVVIEQAGRFSVSPPAADRVDFAVHGRPLERVHEAEQAALTK
jgi:hypothetical protein